MSNKVSVDDMAKVLASELQEYCQDVTDGVKADVKTVAKEAVKELKATSPVDKRKTTRRGRYAKGWGDSVVFEGDFDIRVEVHNKTDYQLAHLLEFGHEVVVGGKVVGHYDGIPHIRPAEENAEDKLMKKVKVRVRK